MRPVFLLALLLIAGAPAYAQRFGLQLKAGGVLNKSRIEILPLSQYETQISEASRFLVGPAFEWRFTPKIAAEFAALFQSGDLNSTGRGRGTFPSTYLIDRSTQFFPVVGKYRFWNRGIAPFGFAGVVFRRDRQEGTVVTTEPAPNGLTQTTRPVDETHVSTGFTAGAGVDIKLGVIRMTPELRYMRFGDYPCAGCITGAESRFKTIVAAMVGIGF